MNKAIEFRGEIFNSIKALAERYGVHCGNVSRRLRSNWTIAQALGLDQPPLRKAHNAEQLVTSIGLFRSVRHAAQALGMEEGTIAARMRQGWTPDEAIGVNKRLKRNPNRGKIISVDGCVFPSANEFADHFGKNRVRTRKRLSSGWTPRQAVDLDPRPPRFRQQDGAARDHVWNQVRIDKKGRKIPHAAEGQFKLYCIINRINGKKYIGITTSDLKTRFRGHWSAVAKGRKSKLYNAMRRAAIEDRRDDFEIILLRSDATDFSDLQEQEVNAIIEQNSIKEGYNTAAGGSIGTAKGILIDGTWFESRSAAAAHFGVPVVAFNLRLSRLGYTPEEAAGLQDREKYGRRKGCSVAGSDFPSLRAASAHYGVKYQTAHRRVTKGWTVEEALGLAKRID